MLLTALVHSFINQISIYAKRALFKAVLTISSVYQVSV